MENFCKGVAFGAIFGMCVGGIIVAKNKKLANTIKEKVMTAEDKLQEAKQSLMDKIQSDDDKCENFECGENRQFKEFFDEKSNFNKKSKK